MAAKMFPKTLCATLAALAGMTFTDAQAAPPPAPERVFISGHSLVDQPLPSHLAAIAASLGTPIQWNRQYMVGSSIRARVRGAGSDRMAWDGYRQGYNREGEGLDVRAEFRSPSTVFGGPYDALLITEEHSLVGSLVWNDTVRHLRHYHDRFIDGNPGGRTWFYEPWLGLASKDDPRRWIAYERAASPIWQCVATRINLSLAAEGRSDRIEPLPAGVALAGLIERATQAPGVPGISAAGVRETVDRLLSDAVHLTPLGVYYVALVSYALMFERPPQGAWAPPGVDPVAARSLQDLAWELTQQERAARRPLSLQACRARLQSSFIADYAAYVRDTSSRQELGRLHAWWRWAKHRLQWHWLLREGRADHPLGDRVYWLPER
jgi:hypothetical protein